MSSVKTDTGNATTCIVCRSGEAAVLAGFPGILSCANCKSAFREPSSRKTDYSRKIAMPGYFATELRNRHHYDFIAKHVGFPAIRRILEIGPGDGALIRYIRARHRDIEIVVIEPGADFCRGLAAIENVRVINDYIENVRLRGEFDMVIMSHVLEHLEDPARALRHVHDTLLKKGGVLYVDVPNREYELRSADAAHAAPETHLIFFDAAGLKKILASAGFAAGNTSGSQYSSLPAGFIRRMEKIGGMKGAGKGGMLLLAYKAMNRIALFALNVYRTVFFIAPREISLDETDPRCNNVALAARK